jgi:hypothetical protein
MRNISQKVKARIFEEEDAFIATYTAVGTILTCEVSFYRMLRHASYIGLADSCSLLWVSWSSNEFSSISPCSLYDWFKLSILFLFHWLCLKHSWQVCQKLKETNWDCFILLHITKVTSLRE